MSIVAIIPVRKNSERVPMKNFKNFNGSSLLEIKINQIKKIKEINKIIVSSDYEPALEMAKKLGVDTHKREDYYASSNISGSEFQEHMGKISSKDCKYVIYCPVTSPLIKTSTIRNIIKEFLKSDNDSLVTCSKFKNFLWLNNKPLNYSLEKIPKSQDLPDIKILNHAICINSRDNIIKNKSFVGKKPILYEIDDYESVDIDNEIDFKFAEFLFKNIK